MKKAIVTMVMSMSLATGLKAAELTADQQAKIQVICDCAAKGQGVNETQTACAALPMTTQPEKATSSDHK